MKFQFPKLVIPEFLKIKNSSDAVINPATEEKQSEMKSLLSEISDLVSIMKHVAYAITRSPSLEGNTGRMRVTVEGLSANQTLTTVTKVGNVYTLGGTISTVDQAYATNRVSWSQNVGNRIP